MFSVHFSGSNDAKQPHLHRTQAANLSPEAPSTSESP